MKNIFKQILLCMLVLFCFILTGCVNKEAEEPKKEKDIEFTVVEDADLPEELKTIIEEKKSAPMKLTYTNKDYLYIVVGYGEQSTGGYSITVDCLYLTKNGIYIDTNLLGPDKQEVVTQALTYPYIVIKMELIDKSVIFN